MLVHGWACMHAIVRSSHLPVFVYAHFYVAVSICTCGCTYIEIHCKSIYVSYLLY